jgi:hypothetical protein
MPSNPKNDSQEGKIPVFRIQGRVKAPYEFTLDELNTMDSMQTENIRMICGSGEPIGDIGYFRGVLLSDVINKAEVRVVDHNDTKKMFVVAGSDDGYKSVFSWQEIFNSPNGESIWVVLENKGNPLHGGNGEVDLLTGCDHLPGPRYVRRLKTIDIITDLPPFKKLNCIILLL